MKIKYREFLKSLLNNNHNYENSYYPVEVLELRSMTAFGVSFIKLLNLFLKECGFKEECCFWNKQKEFYPGTFSYINKMMIEKKYPNYLSIAEYYDKLGEELLIEI